MFKTMFKMLITWAVLGYFSIVFGVFDQVFVFLTALIVVYNLLYRLYCSS